MLRPRPAAGLARRDDLHVRVHVLQGLCRGAAQREVPELRRRVCAASYPPRPQAREVSGLDEGGLEAGRLRRGLRSTHKLPALSSEGAVPYRRRKRRWKCDRSLNPAANAIAVSVRSQSFGSLSRRCARSRRCAITYSVNVEPLSSNSRCTQRGDTLWRAATVCTERRASVRC